MSVLAGASAELRRKRNVGLFITEELVNRTKELGFNLSKTFENHLKHLINQVSSNNPLGFNQSGQIGSPEEIRTLVGGSKARYAWPLHHRASALTLKLNYLLNATFSLKLSSFHIGLFSKKAWNLRYRYCSYGLRNCG